MKVRKSLLCAGAGLMLTACGGGGGDGLGASSYDNEIVVRVEFEDGAAFRNVAAVNGDKSELFVTFDVDDSNTINDGDLRLVYFKERDGSEFDEDIEFLIYTGGSFVDVPVLVTATFPSNVVEWVIDREALDEFMIYTPDRVSESTFLQVEARKVGSDFDSTEDSIPDLAPFAELISGVILDDAGDFDPSSGGSSAVDLRSVRVLFY